MLSRYPWGRQVIRPGSWSRIGNGFKRPIAVGLTGLCLAIFLFFLVTILTTDPWSNVVRLDRGIYQDAALRWLHGGFWFYPFQLSGLYILVAGVVTYPPVALVWLVPAAFLPDALWWGIPIGVTAAMVWHLRPADWAWPLMALCLADPWSAELVAMGNPSLWIMMFIALGTRWRPFFALVLLKRPTCSRSPCSGCGAAAGGRSRLAWPQYPWWSCR